MIAVATILWFIATILLMGFAAGIEMAFYSANRFNIELRKKQGKPGAETLGRFFQQPELFLATTVIGYTVFLVCFSLMFSIVMQPLWVYLGLSERYDTFRLIADIIIATFWVLLFAEFIPRAFFRAHSNFILTHFVWIISIFYQILQPIASAFLGISHWTLKYVFNIRVNTKKDRFNRIDLETLFQQTDKSDFEPQELNTDLFENALELQKVKIRQSLVPRKEIVGIDCSATIEEARQKFIETKLSKLIVYEKNIDNIIGYVHQLDMFKNPDNIQSVLLPIPAVPESMTALDLIGKFTKEGKSIAHVVDEFGGTAGIITMEDVLEELFGEIHDEYDQEEFIEKKVSENEYIFSGRLELNYLSKKYGLKFVENDIETLSGYIISHHETIPQQKERIIVEDYEFDILNVSDTRIEMVKLLILK